MRLTYDEISWNHPCRKLARHYAVKLSRNAGKRTALEIADVAASIRVPAAECQQIMETQLITVRDLAYHASGYRVRMELEGSRVVLKGW